MESINQAQERNNRRFETLESKLNEVASTICPNKMENKLADDAEDSKRLKERLKEALDENKRAKLFSQSEKKGWLEYFFGICQPDGRVGKEGSRSRSKLQLSFILKTSLLSTFIAMICC